ncbi:MAG: hypothetical protein DMD91_27065 [Candidatus Rokuibacteriota bacterium]|nr:MAG: hypothetical protein DMD91_27065 [Candidatus Rokubacteria bacterium]
MTEAARLWSLGAGPGSTAYEVFDAARRRLNRRLAAYLARAMTGCWSATPRCLEAGSGPGYCSRLLAQRHVDLRASLLDLDAEPLRLMPAGGPRAVQGDLYRMPFRDGAFDLVFNFSTMEHLDAFGTAFAEIVRITRPGGKIFVGVPARHSPFLPAAFLPESHPVAVWIGRLYDERQLREACARPDVVVEDRRRYFFGCFVGLLLRRRGTVA